MRKKIALILALAMLFSMIVPMSASAASSNRVTNVPTVQEDDLLTIGAPELVIEEEDEDFGTSTQFFTLRLENAEWLKDGTLDWTAVGGDSADDFESAVANWIYDNSGDTIDDVTVDRITDTRITIEFTPNTTDETLIKVPMWTEITDLGDARVTILRGNSGVTPGTYTFAVAVDDDTVVTIDDIVTFGPEEEGDLYPLIIDETVAGALDFDDDFEFTLPRDFEWVIDDVTTATALGDLGDITIRFGGGLDDQGVQATIEADDRDMTIKFSNASESTDAEGYIIISGLVITSDSERFGDVELDVNGAMSSQSLVVAEYLDFAMDISADGDLEEIIAGRFDDGVEGAGFELTTMLFEEKVEDSIVAHRKVDVEFPSWVKITDVDFDTAPYDLDFEAGDSDFSFQPRNGGSGEVEFEIDIEVTLGADAPHGEDIVATVTGRGLDTDYEVALGVVVQPVTVDMEMTEIVIGESGQAVADITITENVVGGLMEGDLEILFDISALRFHSGYEVEVVNEDESGLEIDDVDTDDSRLIIEIDRESDDEPGVIEITNLHVSLNRIPATADYDVKVGGLALVDNNIAEEDSDLDIEWFDGDDWVWEAPMLRVVTERTVVTAMDVAFTVGQNSYMVDGEMMVMDVAPFISNDRMMIPVRYLEELFGMQPIWNANARSVTVLYEGNVYAMTIGSDMLTLNGAPYMELDATVEIVGDRTFVPASRFARAMGIEYTWDPATQTATFSK